MFKKTYQATHPSMIDGISNEALCDLYQVTDLFVADEISLNYTHNERMIIGGTGWDYTTNLPDEIEACSPDYSIYDYPHSIGFTMRGLAAGRARDLVKLRHILQR